MRKLLYKIADWINENRRLREQVCRLQIANNAEVEKRRRLEQEFIEAVLQKRPAAKLCTRCSHFVRHHTARGCDFCSCKEPTTELTYTSPILNYLNKGNR